MRYYDAHTHKIYPFKSDIVGVYNYRIGEICRTELNDFFSAGIHPYDVEKCTAEWLNKLERVVTDSRCVAVGECGVDKRIADAQKQLMQFEFQAQLAQRIGKPLIVHCVKAQNEVLKVIRRLNVNVVFHSYSKYSEQLSCFSNVYFSLSGRNLQSSVSIDLDRVLLETDDSNESIEQIYSDFAALRSMSVDELKIVIANNFNRVFNR